MFPNWLKKTLYFIVSVFILLNIMAYFHAYKFTHFYAGIPPAKKSDQMSFVEKTSDQ